MGHVLQRRTILLQSGTGITKWDDFYYKVGQVLQSWTGITKRDDFVTKWDRYYQVG